MEDVDKVESFRVFLQENVKLDPVTTASEVGVFLLQRILLDKAGDLIRRYPDPLNTQEARDKLSIVHSAFWLSFCLSEAPNDEPEPLKETFPELATKPAYLAVAEYLSIWADWFDTPPEKAGRSIGAENSEQLKKQLENFALQLSAAAEALRVGPHAPIKAEHGLENYFSHAGVWAVGSGSPFPMPIYVNIREEKGKPPRTYYNLQRSYGFCMPYESAGIDLDDERLSGIFHPLTR